MTSRSTSTPVRSVGDELADAVERYRSDDDVPALLRRLDALAARATIDEIVEAAEPYRDVPIVVGPLYERVVAARPADARALVVLATAYWLAGRGPEPVGELAARAIAADPTHRGGWHLWALTESDPRARVGRWRQVTERFPEDDLALALLADNAASLAGAESDAEALQLAIRTYETLLARAERSEQREALAGALRTLRGWRL